MVAYSVMLCWAGVGKEVTGTSRGTIGYFFCEERSSPNVKHHYFIIPNLAAFQICTAGRVTLRKQEMTETLIH
jgi:hypothetical protein